MSATPTSPRPRATFRVAKDQSARVLARAKIIYAAMVAAVASFPSPTVTMAAFLVLIEAFDAAQQATRSRAKGLATLRNAKRNAVWSAMESLRSYVQSIADSMMTESAAALIESAGMLVAAKPSHGKPLLQAKLTTTPGVVHLIANATWLVGKSCQKNVTFRWQWSSDNGKSWNNVPSTPLADTFVPNLALMTEHQFRVAVTVSRTTGAWSQPVGLVVH